LTLNVDRCDVRSVGQCTVCTNQRR
jgi:hypothetical protein